MALEQKQPSKLSSNLLEITDLWIRDIGCSLNFRKLKKLEELTHGEQLFAAVLTGQREKCLHILGLSGQEETLKAFIDLVKATGFARLALDQLCQMDMLKELSEIHRNEISRLATKETAYQTRTDSDFADVCAILFKLTDSLVWIKGAALSRTIYEHPYHRQYGDLDLVVQEQKFVQLIDTLEKAGFTGVYDPGFCNQLGVGPVEPPEALMLNPAPYLIPSSIYSMQRLGTMIDIKVGPLDRGVQMREIERFFADSIAIRVLDSFFSAPSTIDHLMICVNTFQKDRFASWKTLFDIHLLALELNKDIDLWQTFITRCKQEGLETTAWASLSMVVDRFQTAVPETVFFELAPRDAAISVKSKFVVRHTFVVSPFFVWNATSLPMMLLNATVSSDRDRKLTALRQSFHPSGEFIRRYYNGGKDTSLLLELFCRMIHWLVLLLPGGAIRKTFGKLLWVLPEPKFPTKKMGELDHNSTAIT